MTADNIIFETAQRIFTDLSTPETINAAEAGEWPGALWQAIEESGLALTWVPENNDGVGATLMDGFAVIKAAGAAALPVPLAETLMAGWLLARGGLPVPNGPMTVACGDFAFADGVLNGEAVAVPHGRNAKYLVVVVDTPAGAAALQLAVADCGVTAHAGLAGEPLDRVVFENVKPIAVGEISDTTDAASVEALGALVRCIQAAGALETVLDLSIQYACERVQFGRPIGKFQAIQHSIAELAGEVAAINAAADSAAEAVARRNLIDADARVEIAAAKVRLEQAVSNGAAIAHQVHGAMGFTYEHRLHHLTRRLWNWRDEFGSDTVWAQRLGAQVLEWGAEELWPRITAVSDAR